MKHSFAKTEVANWRPATACPYFTDRWHYPPPLHPSLHLLREGSSWARKFQCSGEKAAVEEVAIKKVGARVRKPPVSRLYAKVLLLGGKKIVFNVRFKLRLISLNWTRLNDTQYIFSFTSRSIKLTNMAQVLRAAEEDRRYNLSAFEFSKFSITKLSSIIVATIA